MAYKGNIGREWTKCRKWRKRKVKLWIVLFAQSNPKNSTQNPFMMVRVLPKWHLNGKLVENDGNVQRWHKIAVKLIFG